MTRTRSTWGTDVAPRPDRAARFDDRAGAWFRRGFFVGLGLLASMPAAMLAAYVVLRALAEGS